MRMRLAKMFPLCLWTSLFGWSCDSSYSESQILVDVSSVPSRTIKLTVTATLYGQPARKSEDVTSQFDRFGLKFPSSLSGHLTLSATAFDSDGCTQGSGQTSVDLPVPFAEIALQLTAQSPRKCPNLEPCAAGTICSIKYFLTDQDLKPIWSFAPDDIWAGGDNGTLLHYDGTAWTLYDKWGAGVYSHPAPGQYFHGIWGAASDDVWAVGTAGIIYHYDGTRWSSQQSIVPQSLYSIWGVSNKEIWAVGNTPTGGGQPAVLRYNGFSWQPITNAGIGTSGLLGLWAAKLNTDYSIYAGTGVGTLLHSDGASWNTVSDSRAMLPTGKVFRAIWGTSDANNIFAVGLGGTMVRFRNGVWTLPYSSNNDLLGIFGDGTRLVAVGGKGTVVRADSPYDTFVMQSGGPDLSNLYGVSFSSNGICWVVGTGGYLGYLDLRP